MTEFAYKIRNKLIKRVSSLSRDKLVSLKEFLDQIEPVTCSKEETLSFASSLKDMDDGVFADLTDRLHDNRMQGQERIL